MRPRHAAYLIAGFWLFAVLVFGVIERIADPKTFTSVWLGFWWAIQTVTTVGYGDIVPEQTSGKVLASVLMVGGLSLLSIVTATITSVFVTRRQAEMQAAGEDPVMERLNEIAAQLERLEAELHRPGSD
jgi:voltage-gated potassium channel